MNSPTRWPAARLSELLQLDAAEVRRRLRQAGLQTGRGVTYTMKEVVKAFAPLSKTDELRAAKLEKLRREEELLSIEVAVKRRDLVPLEECNAAIRSAFAPIRESLLAAPSTLCHKTNPADPQHARRQITEWLDGVLSYCHERVTK